MEDKLNHRYFHIKGHDIDYPTKRHFLRESFAPDVSVNVKLGGLLFGWLVIDDFREYDEDTYYGFATGRIPDDEFETEYYRNKTS